MKYFAYLGVVILAIASAARPAVVRSDSAVSGNQDQSSILPKDFFIAPSELTLRFRHELGERRLSFRRFAGSPRDWKAQARDKLAVLLKVRPQTPGQVREVREIRQGGIMIKALVMEVDEHLSIPAYLLIPEPGEAPKSAVMAIHGHGRAEPCVGAEDDYHHRFALELAKAGHLVLCPELRGFGALKDLADGLEIDRLDYWIGRYSQFTLVTDGFLTGRTLIGETVEDLLRWEAWLAESRGIKELDAAGISYGGDLSLIYPVFSQRVRRIFASGTLGSFSVIFQRCYNAPAHCIPGILEWMDRSDIAGLNAPRPLTIHYGELDTPSPTNASASYNETVSKSMEELGEIYGAFGARDAVTLIVTPGAQHEMDIRALLDFLND
jgi:dienelactone hydrolase